ncbi:MAG: hypothetical protein R3C68_02040 [Myxococcota bacterium]
MTTPDGYFVVESRLENSDLDPLVLIDAICRHDVQLGFTSLYAAD